MFVRFEADVIAKPCLPYFIALDRDTSSVGIDIVPHGNNAEHESSSASLLPVLTRKSSMRDPACASNVPGC